MEEFHSDPLGHTYSTQTKSSANGDQLDQRSQLALQTGAMVSRAAAFPISTGQRTTPQLFADGAGPP